jgi:hypothetical protein
MIRAAAFWVLSLFLSLPLFSQTDFSISLNNYTGCALPGLQSYAFGEWEGNYVFIGGRTEGLHLKQPWVSFHPDQRNTNIVVWSATEHRTWTIPTSGLPTELHEQLSSSNIQFYQDGKKLILVGGYGYCKAIDDKKSFPALIVIDLPSLIAEVKKGTITLKAFQVISDESFAVCGGQLEQLNGVYYLVGGHRFDGSYNPKGNPTYVQNYVNGHRSFRLKEMGQKFELVQLESQIDTTLLHRRDYNLAPTMIDGKPGLMAFSGVFQMERDMPYRNVVRMSDGGDWEEVDGFYQSFNHYHTAHIDLYDSSKEKVHHYFLGGIGEYYLHNDTIIQDSNTPFVKTISHVEVDKGGKMKEFATGLEMPDYLGSGAHFLMAPGLPKTSNGLIDVAAFKEKRVLLGYVFGGIKSKKPNIFWENEGEDSEASTLVQEIYWEAKSSIEKPNVHSGDGLKLEVYTNANMDEFNVTFELKEPSDIYFALTSQPYRDDLPVEAYLGDGSFEMLEPGDQHFSMTFEQQIKGLHYFTFFVKNEEVATWKVVVE